MATLGSPSPPSSPSRTLRRRGWARRIERSCCTAVTFFPLLFVYSITSWAAWVLVGIGFRPASRPWTARAVSVLGALLYLLLNWSYTSAVFTDPGSPLSLNNGYSHLPTHEAGGLHYTSFTVKASTGELRFCSKCQSKKPDRAHHCSTCKRCVLKMDHHCPWLATCVGLRNYKAFLLFLVYLTLFCWTCFASSAAWVWTEILSDGQYNESLMPVNYVLLAVLSGIIGIVITGFTGWHLWLTARGQTTIESLEKTRYLSPLRQAMKQNYQDRNYVNAQATGRLSISDQLREIHANALPGVTRPEEGEPLSRPITPTGVPASDGHITNYSQQTFGQRERQQNQNRYDSYLDERDNELLPNAFDLGWKKNLLHVFGASPFKWLVPLYTTTGDGWSWEASPKWLAARERIRLNREDEDRQQKQRELAAGWGVHSPTEADFRHHQPHSVPIGQSPQTANWDFAGRDSEHARFLTTTRGVMSLPYEGRRSPNKADQILGRERHMYADDDMQLQTLDRRKFDEYNYVSEEDENDRDETSTDGGLTFERRVNSTSKSTSGIPRETKSTINTPLDTRLRSKKS